MNLLCLQDEEKRNNHEILWRLVDVYLSAKETEMKIGILKGRSLLVMKIIVVAMMAVSF